MFVLHNAKRLNPFSRSLSLSLPGSLRVEHDEHGVPTIFGQTPDSCIFGQGYISAFHRLWQMEQQRRIASARLSEVMGTATRDIDRWICQLGLKEAVEAGYEQVKTDAAALLLLEQYAEGVNYFIQSTRRWGVEFTVLGIQPEPWTPRDTVSIMTLLAWWQAGNWEEQLVRLQVLAALGPEKASLLEVESFVSFYRKQQADGIHQALTRMGEILPGYDQAKQQASVPPRRSGSNAWVVAGSYTTSGKPILAADPHLPLGLPGFFYEIEMKTEDNFVVAGAAIPGIPGVLSGRNADLAWSCAVTGAATAEVRIERITDPVPHIHTFAIKGQQPETVEVSWGRCGPILPSTPDLAFPEYRLSVEWVGHRGNWLPGTLRALWSFGHCHSGQEFTSALRSWEAPVLTFVWAEVEKHQGEYGWQVAGSIPLRRHPEEGFMPGFAWEAAGQWAEGFIPAQELPGEKTPACGYVVAANHRMTLDYPYTLGHEYLPAFRAQQIEKLIQNAIKDRRYSAEQAAAIQTDWHSQSALALAHHLLEAEEKQVNVRRAALTSQALYLLRQWQGDLAISSSAAAIIKLTEDHLFYLVAERLFAQPILAHAWLGLGKTPLNPGLLTHWRMRELVLHLLSHRPGGLFPRAEWEELFRQGFLRALSELTALQGKDPARWSWGKLHQLELVHPLVQVPVYQTLPFHLRVFKRFFRLSRGPFPLGGDEHSPWQTSTYPMPERGANHPRRLWATAYQPAWRLIAEQNRCYYGCLPGGVSGHMFQRWSDNQLPWYVQGRYHQRTL